jgi:hypothetical protein
MPLFSGGGHTTWFGQDHADTIEGQQPTGLKENGRKVFAPEVCNKTIVNVKQPMGWLMTQQCAS